MKIKRSREVRLAWAAGFIDGEGCFWAGGNKRFVIEIVVAQRVEEPLIELQDVLGCGRVSLSTARSRTNPVYLWRVKGSNSVSNVIKQIRPYLIVKAEQADILQRLCYSTRFSYAAWDPEYKLMMRGLADELRVAKP